MLEVKQYRCPHCRWVFRRALEDGEIHSCQNCSREYRVLLDQHTGRAGLVDPEAKTLREPLGMPKGSVRALTAVAMAVCCWAMVLMRGYVPDAMLALMLTIVGYYFGFRVKTGSGASRIYDATEDVARPMFLPGGMVRLILILALGMCALSLNRLELLTGPYAAFFILLAGLIAGHVFARISSPFQGTRGMEFVGHLKAAAVLVIALTILIVLLAGLNADWPPSTVSLLCAAVSFYYGSRT